LRLAVAVVVFGPDVDHADDQLVRRSRRSDQARARYACQSCGRQRLDENAPLSVRLFDRHGPLPLVAWSNAALTSARLCCERSWRMCYCKRCSMPNGPPEIEISRWRCARLVSDCRVRSLTRRIGRVRAGSAPLHCGAA
jgi:hypothetical protein